MTSSPNVLVRVRYYDKGSDKRGFYASEKTNDDYLGYIDSGHKAGKYSDYMDYQGNREKTTGVFSTNGLLTPEEKANVRKMLKATDSVIWDIVISTEENYGKDKLTSWRSAQEVLNQELPIFLKDNRMSIDRCCWVAGLHENTDNRHIHLLLFEKEMECFDPDTKQMRFHRGMLSRLALEDFKLRIERRLNGHEYSLHQYRDKLLDLEDQKLQDIDDTAVYTKDLKSMLLDLYRELPKGNFGYESHKADEIRPLVDQITTYMLTGDELSMSTFMSLMRKLKKRDEETREICERNKVDPAPHLVSKAFKDDIYRRCGNKILKYIRTAQDMKGDFRKGGNEQKKRWDEKVRRGWLYSRAARLDADVNRERIESFDTFERLLEKAEHDRLVEEGVIEAE